MHHAASFTEEARVFSPESRLLIMGSEPTSCVLNLLQGRFEFVTREIFAVIRQV
jgi:hypothetical protein